MLASYGESKSRWYRYAKILAVVLLAVHTSGCEDWEWTPWNPFPSGRCQVPPFDVDGVWELQGEGTRSSCDVASRNGRLSFRTTAWEVRQFFETPDKPGCSTLSVSTRNVDGGVENAETRGNDVMFSTWETFQYADGTEATIELRWNGTRGTDGRFSGSVGGSSTDGCRIRGTFRASVTP